MAHLADDLPRSLSLSLPLALAPPAQRSAILVYPGGPEFSLSGLESDAGHGPPVSSECVGVRGLLRPGGGVSDTGYASIGSGAVLIACHSDRTASYVCSRSQFAMYVGSCGVQHALEYRLAHEQHVHTFWKRPV